jgi:small subunit ribosomal protein S6
MQRTYEVMFIVRPDTGEEDLDKLVSGIEGTITQNGGTVKSVEKMGVRRLAYTVRRFQEGHYVLLQIEADGNLVSEIERRLRVTEPVIKFLSVRMDEEEKRHAKFMAHRESRKKMSAQPVAAAPEQAEETQPAEATPASA